MIGSLNIHSFARLFLVSVFALGLPLASAFAHSQLVKAEPPRRAVLTKSPTQVRLWFNENIEGDYASLVVLDAKKQPISDERPTLAPDDPKSIVLPLPELAPGKYSVKFRVLSVDGHVVESSFDFSIKGGNQEK
ncbi:MAG: copper resistance protein CopC [Nitrospira sp.]|nr:copper resistance protein CopC [Nitrospira sp.]MDH4370238.1 copper resistance protein CopC [Nitrospira sp.]MDH5348872.1 copper resistance protein CopC [Nitrospira sp.]MDH5498018.1 copper resistance protein CopC [Nitrospira sp.]MDH5726872.1 copper resistance protein CopC [Nitrospira sp.]